MTPLAVRYEIFKALGAITGGNTDLMDVAMVSPVPGEPVKLRVETRDPVSVRRTYTVTVSESDPS